MKIVISTPNIVEAEQIIALLEDDGIEAHMLEDNSPYISASGDMSNYRVMVNDDDAPSAEKVVEAYRRHNATAETAKPWCPECGSEDVAETVIRHRFGSVWLLLLAPVLVAIRLLLPMPPVVGWVILVLPIAFVVQFFIGYKVHRFQCNKCNHIFKQY